jgi:hypothetical protein
MANPDRAGAILALFLPAGWPNLPATAREKAMIEHEHEVSNGSFLRQ